MTGRSRAPGGVVALLVALVALALPACGDAGGDAQGSGRFDGYEIEETQDKPEIVLTDTEGEPYDFVAETEGEVAVLFFGYTSCPDICPLQMANLAGALDGDPGLSAEVVFVSVDPEVDTPEKVREFLDRYDSDFVGLTGEPEALRQAQRDALVPVATEAVETDDGTRDVGHAAQAIGFGRDGKAYVFWPSGTRQSTFAHDLEVLSGITAEEPASG